MKRVRSSQVTRVLLAFVTCGVITLGAHWVRVPTSITPNFPCIPASLINNVSVEIPNGATGSEVAILLYRAGVIKSSAAYFRVAVGDARSQKVSAGAHNLQRSICARDALEQLLDAKRLARLVDVTEGIWKSEVTKALIAANFSPGDIVRGYKAVSLPKGMVGVEGLFYPARYSFDKNTTAQGAIQSLIAPRITELSELGIISGTSQFSLNQILTIASLIQAEGNLEDFPKISRVVRNRLSKGMPLQFDSTVHYIKGSRGSVFLSTQTTHNNSPYNTYQRYGLPPGPINSPSHDAILAALNPTSGDWLFFITVAPHDTRYTSSINEFNKWKLIYKKNLAAGLFDKKK